MVMRAIMGITEIEQTVERLADGLPAVMSGELNQILTDLQSGLLPELEEGLGRFAGG